MSEYGDLLKEAKKLLGVTYTRMADTAGIRSGTLRAIVHGKQAHPNNNTVNCINAAVAELANEHVLQLKLNAQTMRELCAQLRACEFGKRPRHIVISAPELYRKAFCAALDRGGISMCRVEVEADVSFNTVRNFVSGRVIRPIPITAQLIGIGTVRLLEAEAENARTDTRKDELRMLAEDLKNAYKADYGDDLM